MCFLSFSLPLHRYVPKKSKFAKHKKPVSHSFWMIACVLYTSMLNARGGSGGGDGGCCVLSDSNNNDHLHTLFNVFHTF